MTISTTMEKMTDKKPYNLVCCSPKDSYFPTSGKRFYEVRFAEFLENSFSGKHSEREVIEISTTEPFYLPKDWDGKFTYGRDSDRSLFYFYLWAGNADEAYGEALRRMNDITFAYHLDYYKGLRELYDNTKFTNCDFKTYDFFTHEPLK